jgi:hypothetical protein
MKLALASWQPAALVDARSAHAIPIETKAPRGNGLF